MALVVRSKCTVLTFGIILLILCDCDVTASTPCSSDLVPKEFNETIVGETDSECRARYVFSYDFRVQQKWVPHICVSSPSANKYKPLLVSVRESLNIMSFEVPYGASPKNSFSKVCHALCPLENYYEQVPGPGIQKIYVELTTASESSIQFEMNFTAVENFILLTNSVVHLNITPSQPYVLQYNMNFDVSAVRIEVKSNSSDCMLLGIQDLQCPFYDTETTIAYDGFYQTLTTQAGVIITRNVYGGQVYIVLIQRATDKCVHSDSIYKEITLSFSPTATDNEAFTAVFIVLLIYAGVCLVAFLIMLDWKKRCPDADQTDSIGDEGVECQGVSIPLMDKADVTADQILKYLKQTSENRNQQNLLESFQKIITIRDYIELKNYFSWRYIRDSLIKSLPEDQYSISSTRPEDAIQSLEDPQTSRHGNVTSQSDQNISEIELEADPIPNVTSYSLQEEIDDNASEEISISCQKSILLVAAECEKMDFSNSIAKKSQKKISDLLLEHKNVFEGNDIIAKTLLELWKSVEQRHKDGAIFSAQCLGMICRAATCYRNANFLEFPDLQPFQRRISALLSGRLVGARAYETVSLIVQILEEIQKTYQNRKQQASSIEFNVFYQERVIEATNMFNQIYSHQIFEIPDCHQELSETLQQHKEKEKSSKDIIKKILNELLKMWKILGKESLKNENDVKQRNMKKSEIFTWNLVITAVFYVLPAGQVAFINQKHIYYTGNQDMCYYNYLCSYQWLGFFFDFNHVYSNIGYIILGGLFIFIVCRRRATTTAAQKCLDPHQAKGLYIHFGIQIAMGIALIMEGLLSAIYHVCPNEQDFQFDLTFMYVICVLSMMSLHQARHPILTDKPHATFFVLAVLIFICVCGTLFPGLATYIFWGIFGTVHIPTMAVLCAKVYYRHHNAKLTVFRRPWHNPLFIKAAKYKGRATFLICVWIINVAIHIYYIIKGLDTLGDLLLQVLILNTLLYLVYYGGLKVAHKETFCWKVPNQQAKDMHQSEDGYYNICKVLSPVMPFIYFTLFLIFAVFALINFKTERTNWRASPAESRQLNDHCLMGNFYDEHDLWHFLSSFAVFFLFLTIITLDDGLTEVPRKYIAMF